MVKKQKENISTFILLLKIVFLLLFQIISKPVSANHLFC